MKIQLKTKKKYFIITLKTEIAIPNQNQQLNRYI